MTDFERRATLWEKEAGESISDLLKIGCVVKGLEKGTFRDHLLIATTQTKTWPEFIKEVENVNIAHEQTHRVPMDLSDLPKSFDGNCSWCEAYGHMARDCRKKANYMKEQKDRGASGGGKGKGKGDKGGKAKDGKGKDGGKKGSTTEPIRSVLW